MQLTAMRTQVLYRAGMDSNDAIVPAAVLTAFINAALREVAMIQDWDWNWASETINSVSGTASYARAADCRKTDRVIDDADGGLLVQLSRAQAQRYVEPASTSSLIPRFWYVQGGNLVLVPTPTSARAYTHVYVAAEPTLSGDTDEPDIPDWAIDLVLVKAAKMVAVRTDNTSQLQLLADAERALLDAIDDEARRSRGGSVIQSRRDWRVR